MAKLYAEHVIPMEAHAYFRLNNDPEFEQFQAERINLESYEEVERSENGGKIHRRIQVVPDIQLPGAIRKVVDKQLGDRKLYYEELRDYVDGELEYTWKIVPPVMADRMDVGGKVVVEPIDEGSCKRILDGETKANVFGIGGMLEKFLVREMTNAYDLIPGVVKEWNEAQGNA